MTVSPAMRSAVANSRAAVAAALLLGACVFFAPPAFCFEASRFELLQDRDYTPALLRLIGGARTSINVCMFQAIVYPRKKSSPSNQILNALVQAHRRGVQVTVVLDNGGSLGDVAKTNTLTARFLTQAGIAVYFDSSAVTTHTKCITVDAKVAVLGSTNWTYSALARNHELSAVIHSPEAAQHMNRYFDMVRSQGQRF